MPFLCYMKKNIFIMKLAKQEQLANFQPFLKISIFWILESTLKIIKQCSNWRNGTNDKKQSCFGKCSYKIIIIIKKIIIIIIVKVPMKEHIYQQSHRLKAFNSTSRRTPNTYFSKDFVQTLSNLHHFTAHFF